jgi:hypothetical protein
MYALCRNAHPLYRRGVANHPWYGGPYLAYLVKKHEGVYYICKNYLLPLVRFVGTWKTSTTNFVDQI